MESLKDEAIAWAASHGLEMMNDENTFVHAPITLFPTEYDRDAFLLAIALAEPYNRLVDAVSRDTTWLYNTLETVSDPFTRRLVEISKTIESEGIPQEYYLGINRSDYMCHEGVQLLQIELNTIASSFGCLSSKVSEMHEFLLSRYTKNILEQNHYDTDIQVSLCSSDDWDRMLPNNNARVGISSAIAEAAKFKLTSSGKSTDNALVVFVVQPGEKNAFDQRALEYELWYTHGVRTVRRTLAQLASQALLNDDKTLIVDGHEVAAVYFRAGYSPNDYPSETEWQGRLLVERSDAIKCPSIAYHLVGTKKVQQKLAAPGEVERFVSEEDAQSLRKSFTGLWSLDTKDIATSQDAIESAKRNPENYVVKPQREGGGNNLYGQEAKNALETMDANELASYILMQRIFPKSVKAIMLRKGQAVSTTCIQELGVYGCYLGNGSQVVFNHHVGHLLRTKALGVDEGGVATGYSCLDSPILK